jgi:hypothetical protein
MLALSGDSFKYLKDRFNYEYLIWRFGYPSHFAGTNNCELIAGPCLIPNNVHHLQVMLLAATASTPFDMTCTSFYRRHFSQVYKLTLPWPPVQFGTISELNWGS